MTSLKVNYLDVSELSPPEPMVIILSALSHLATNHYLKIKHSRVPYPLFDHLTANNWCYQYSQEYSQENVQNITLYIYRIEYESELNNIISRSIDAINNECG